VTNLRKQLEKLNNYKFSDSEWNNFFKTEIANQNYSIEEKTKTIQEDHIKILKKED
jgi:type I restriction enzyme R subunit